MPAAHRRSSAHEFLSDGGSDRSRTNSGLDRMAIGGPRVPTIGAVNTGRIALGPGGGDSAGPHAGRHPNLRTVFRKARDRRSGHARPDVEVQAHLGRNLGTGNGGEYSTVPRHSADGDAGAVGGATTAAVIDAQAAKALTCLLYTSPSPRDRQKSRMPSS